MQKDYNGKVSPMSIIALILSILGCTGLIGVVLGIIDVTKKDGRKKGLSITAIIIGMIMTIVAFTAIGASPRKDKVSEKVSVENTEKITEESEKPDLVQTTTDTPTPEPTETPTPTPEPTESPEKQRSELTNEEYCNKYATDFIVGASMTLDRFLTDYDMSLAPQKWTISKFDETDTLMGTTDISWQGKKGRFQFVGTLNFEGDKVVGVTPHYVYAMDEVLGNDGYCDDFFNNINEAAQYFNQ